MKIIYLNNKLRHSYALWSMIILLTSLFITGCTDDYIDTPVLPNPGGEASVILSVNTPRPTLPLKFTRSQTASETMISDVTVLVFEYTNDEYIYKYYSYGTEITATNDFQTRFRILLSGSRNPLKFILLVNARHGFLGSAPSPGTPESEVRRQLESNFSASGWEGNLPMYGETLLPDGTASVQNQTLQVTLLRTLARVDVEKHLVAESPGFDFREVYIYRAGNKIQLIPNELSSVDPPKVGAPSVPENSQSLPDPMFFQTTEGDAQNVNQIYIPESKAATTNIEKLSGVTTIVIGGRFNDDPQITYYRVDFDSGIDGHPFGQVLRNHRYIFNIRKVMSSGWSTPEEAASNIASSMNVEIQTWEDFSTDIYFDEHRFGISSREISLRYLKNRERSLEVESTLLYQIQWLDAENNPVGNKTSDYNSVISNEHFDVWISRNGSDADKITRLVFRTRNDNLNGEIKTSKLRITVEKWQIDVTVTQDNTTMYSDRSFRVLSVATHGDLGALATASANGVAMRAILDKQLTLGGVIQIGGFAFMRVPNDNTAPGVSSGANLGQMQRIIDGQDVIYFPYNVSVSDEIADILLRWLNASPRRVLIVGTDTDATNKKLRERLTDDGTWNFGSISTVSNNYQRAAASAGSEDFFNGPFGIIGENATFKRADGTAGYCSNYPTASVTPLITGDRSGYTNHMFLGVNKTRRIIYHGDADLFTGNALSNNNGNVTSDLDKLMANMWAWITEQIIYGNE